MAERLQCEFSLIRYVPDVVKGEFVNIGVVLRNAGGAEVRFTRDWARVRCMDAGCRCGAAGGAGAGDRDAAGGEEKVAKPVLELLGTRFRTACR